MNTKIKKGVSYILAALLTLSVSACGSDKSSSERKSSENPGRNDTSISQDDNSNQGGFIDDNNGGNGGNSGENDNSAPFGNLPTDVLNEKVDFKICKVGSDSLCVIIRSNLCGKMGDSTEWNSYGEKDFHLQMEDGSYWDFQHNNCNLCIKEGGSENYYWTNSSYGETFAGTDVYYTRIREPEAVQKLNTAQSFVLTYKDYSTGTSNGQRVLEGRLSDVMADLSEDDFAKLQDETFNKMVTVNAAKGPWEGEYIINWSRNLDNGSVSVSKTDGGLLVFKLNLGEIQETIYAVEKEYDAATYAYGTIINAKAEGLNGKQESGSCGFSYSLDEDGKEKLNVNYYSYGSNNEFSCQEELDRFTLWHMPKAGYVDKDESGAIDSIDVKNDPYFAAITDDYMINYDPDVNTYAGGKDYKTKRAVLSCFDKNERCCKRISRYEFASESEANEFYTAYGSYLEEGQKLNVSGKFAYLESRDSDAYQDSKIDCLASTGWKIGIHYFEGAYQDSYIYLSKPFTKDEYFVNFEDTMFWKNVGDGSVQSFDNDTANIYIEVDAVRSALRMNGSVQGNEDLRFAGDDPVIFTGKYGLACGVAWGYEDGNQIFYLDFTEFVVEGNKLIATDYFFKGDNNYFFDDKINLTNFKEKGAELVVKSTFDLTQVD
ncbi:MAG: hypothetical protein K6E32_03255 [Lachnospiraceae bacterium]|nr:hypothetical protein [Lachnospiraceae bacterium]